MSEERKVVIDDVELEVDGSMTLIQACEEAGIEIYKIASRTVADKNLCKKIISTKKKVIISLGMYDFKKNPLPFKGENIIYLYCVSKYPTSLS